MMFRRYGPGASIFSLLMAGFLSLFKSSKKIRRPASTTAEAPYMTPIKRVVGSHTDCTAEVFNIFVSGTRRVRIFSELTPGDRVELRLREGEVAVYAGGKYMSTPILPDSSRLPQLLESDTTVEAYLGGRDVTASTDAAEFCSIIAFYKISGVPPTKVLID